MKLFEAKKERKMSFLFFCRKFKKVPLSRVKIILFFNPFQNIPIKASNLFFKGIQIGKIYEFGIKTTQKYRFYSHQRKERLKKKV